MLLEGTGFPKSTKSKSDFWLLFIFSFNSLPKKRAGETHAPVLICSPCRGAHFAASFLPADTVRPIVLVHGGLIVNRCFIGDGVQPREKLAGAVSAFMERRSVKKPCFPDAISPFWDRRSTSCLEQARRHQQFRRIAKLLETLPI